MIPSSDPIVDSADPGPSLPAPASDSVPAPPATRPLLSLVVAVIAVLLVYLVFAVPASWFPSSPVKQWGVRDLTLPRGIGSAINSELVITGTDATGQVYVAIVTDLRARDYATISWNARNLPADAEVHFLWRSDYAPKKVFSVPVAVEAGRLLPVVLANDAGWLGHVTGIGLSIRGTMVQPYGIAGATAKPSGALGILSDRAREWLAFEPWRGTSINSIAGGDDLQPLSLPLLLAVAIALAGAIYRRAGASSEGGVEAVISAAVPPNVSRKAFETPDQQLSLFDGSTMADQIASLRETMDEIETQPDTFQDLVRAWSLGDTKGLERETAALRRASPALYRRLVSERNAAWVTTLAERLQGRGRTVVIVGVGHLIGHDGVPARLRALGYSVSGP